MQDLIERNREKIAELCRQHHVRSLSVFGSAVRDDFDLEKSDVDLLVEFDPLSDREYAPNFFALLRSLDHLFGRKVDLLTEPSLSIPIFAGLSKTVRSLCMLRELSAYLQDILDAGQDILTYIGDQSSEEYQRNGLIKAAVERKFTIIGEALNQALEYYPELQGKIRMDRDVVAFRDRVIHGYFTVNDPLIYSITKQDLPNLMQEGRVLFRELGP